MNNILVDSSVWIEYFKGSEPVKDLDELIDTNQICTNDLILSELIPFLYQKNEKELIELLQLIRKIPIRINWEEIISLQINNLKNGINNVGIPDLIILQNIKGNNLVLYTNDKHFLLMKEYEEFRIYVKN